MSGKSYPQAHEAQGRASGQQDAIHFGEHMSAKQNQIGGEHYKKFSIQPVEYIHANKLTYLVGNVIKYVTRHQYKNGAEDIKKAIHYCELILEMEYKDDKTD